MKKVALWILAFMITASTAVYQRMTGPTHPLRGSTEISGTEIAFTLLRSYETGSDYEIRILAPDPAIQGSLVYKKHKTDEPWQSRAFNRVGDSLTATLPHQPPAGKLAYRVLLSDLIKEVSLSGDKPVVIRFKGHVPDVVLIPHIVIMFLAMLFSTRAGLEALRRKGNPRKLVLWTAAILFVGGMVFGPLVQKFAFGTFWAGIPFGFDLTDNKTLIALLGWIAALIAGRKGRPARGWVIGAALLLLIVFLIPHSLLGSELDYSEAKAIPQLSELLTI